MGFNPLKSITKELGRAGEKVTEEAGGLFSSVGKEFERFYESDLGKLAIMGAIAWGTYGLATGAFAPSEALVTTAGEGLVTDTAAGAVAGQTAGAAGTTAGVATPVTASEGIIGNVATGEVAQSIAPAVQGPMLADPSLPAQHMANLPAGGIQGPAQPSFMDRVLSAGGQFAKDNPWPATMIASQGVSSVAGTFQESPTEEAARVRERERRAANERMRGRRPVARARLARPGIIQRQRAV